MDTAYGGINKVDAGLQSPEDQINLAHEKKGKLAAGKFEKDVSAASSPYTLTTDIDTYHESQNPYFRYHGTRASALTVIHSPTVTPRLFIVFNDATTQTITVKVTSGGSGIAVRTGETRILRHDGTNVYDILTSLHLVDEINEVSITAAVTITSSGYGKMHVITGTSADYTITLPTPGAADLGKVIGFRVALAGTKLYTLDAGSGKTIDGQQTLVMRSTTVVYLKAVGTSGECWQVMGYKRLSEAFIAPTLQNSWVNFGLGYSEAGYRMHNGMVILRGTVKTGTVNSTLFTLPAGYRPSVAMRFAVHSNAAFGCIEVQTDGDVVQIAGVNTSLSLDDIQFQPA